MERDYDIPDSKIGFYGTGLFGLSESEAASLRSIVGPYKDFFMAKLTPHHLSCRYLGYFDEYSQDEILKLSGVLAPIYKKYLPFECATGKLFGSWETRPDSNKRLLMIEINSPRFQSLHDEIFAATKNYRVFEEVEVKNVRPHVSIGRIKDEINIVPDELLKKMESQVSHFTLAFTKAYIFTPGGVKEIGLDAV